MFTSILAAAVAATVAPQALANLYITSPVASTSCTAGALCPVSWQDDGTTPALGTIGACTVGLYVGSQTTQYLLQTLGDVDLLQQSNASFFPDATVGGNSDLYFLRFTATNYQVNGAPFEGFSAKFTLSGMTGTFNNTEASLMTAPTVAIGGSTTPGASTTASGASTTGSASASPTGSKAPTSVATVTKSSSTGGSSPSPNANNKSGAASPLASSSTLTGVVAVMISAFFAAVAF